MTLSSVAARLRSLWRGLVHRAEIEAEMTEEFRHHLLLRTEDLVAHGIAPAEAARKARLEFGHIDGHKADARASRGLASVDQLRFSALDVKLGVRMLGKYPGMSLVAVMGMAMAIAIAVGAFSVIASLMTTAVPLPEGDRVVAVRNAILTEPGRHQASLRDFATWRSGLRSVQELAAFTSVQKNLLIAGAAVELVPVVRMTASGFKLARTAPLLGRTLIEDDERTDAHVIVIGYEEWQRRYAADPSVIGRTVRLDGTAYTIVGVMPEGFRFPIDDRYWIPLVFTPAERARADAVPLTVVGRLASGATIEGAQAELTTIGTRMAAAYPATHAQLRPQVLSYTRAYFDIDSPETIWTLYMFRLFVSLVLVVVAVNVAVLVYARTATRAGEIAVRTALGASRARVVAQLFAEALVLSVTAAVIGLAIAGVALAKLQALAVLRMDQLPFWLKLGLSPGAISYALLLAIVGAAIVGIAPALKATGRRVQSNLQQLSGHGARMQLGRVWTVLIVTQVAVAVAVLPYAVALTQEAIGDYSASTGYSRDEFLDASLSMGSPAALRDTSASRRALDQGFNARAHELIGRLERDPAVAGLTVRFPSDWEHVEVENTAPPVMSTRRTFSGTAGVEHVDAHFFALYDMPIMAGRAFVQADTRAGATAIIVNKVFAADHLGSGPVLGRRLRFIGKSDTAGAVKAGPWLEIVGVVRDFAEL